jgi:methionine-rich copper-binding protein CopC
MTRSFLTTFGARACAAALLLTFAQWASAHAYPKQRVPAAGATVGADTRQVSIEFDDALERAFSSIKVLDASGADVTNGKARVDAHDKKHMTVALQALKPGAYTVSWVAVAVDGHRTQGHYTFNVK